MRKLHTQLMPDIAYNNIISLPSTLTRRLHTQPLQAPVWGGVWERAVTTAFRRLNVQESGHNRAPGEWGYV